MAEALTRFVVLVESDGEAEDDEREEWVTELAQDLRDTDADLVEVVRAGPPPEGSKAVDGLAIGLAVSATPAVISHLLTMLRSWSSQRRRPCVLRLAGPSGAVIEIPDVPLDQLEAVMKQLNLSPEPEG